MEKQGIYLLKERLNNLLSDEDLTDEKLREASEGLLPSLADWLNNTGNDADGISSFLQEREKQIDKYGFTGEHHFSHPEWYENGQLRYAASILVRKDSFYKKGKLPPVPENWDKDWWERICEKPFEEKLVIVGTLIAAEIDRVNYEK